MIEHSPSIVAIAAALLKFQGALKGVKRDSANPFFKSKYADLEQVVETAKPHLQDAGIAFLQSPGSIQNECLSMSTMLMHAESGEWIIGTGEIPLGKKDPQGAGSAQTYAQRYHLMAMLGLPPVDDDGESAMDRSRYADTPPKPSARPVETGTVDLTPQEQEAIDKIAANIDFALEQSGPNLAKVWKENWSTIQALPKHFEDALTQKKDKLKANMLPK